MVGRIERGSEATERWVGKRFKINNGKLNAVVVDAVSNSCIRIDYDGYLDPTDKRSRLTGRKLATLEELRHPELIIAGEFSSLMYKK